MVCSKSHSVEKKSKHPHGPMSVRVQSQEKRRLRSLDDTMNLRVHLQTVKATGLLTQEWTVEMHSSVYQWARALLFGQMILGIILRFKSGSEGVSCSQLCLNYYSY